MNEPQKKCIDLYLGIVREADLAFSRVREQFDDFVRCAQGCNDCCFAVFELHPVEAIYLSHAFQTHIKRKERREIQRRANKARER